MQGRQAVRLHVSLVEQNGLWRTRIDKPIFCDSSRFLELTSGFDVRAAHRFCSIACSSAAPPILLESDKLFMSVSFMGAPAEGSFSARAFRPRLCRDEFFCRGRPWSPVRLPLMVSACTPPCVELVVFNLQKRCVEVHRAEVARNERQVAFFLQHRGVHEL